MAQRTVVSLVDDLDGGAADETVGFGLDGARYEIDLSAGHARALREALAGYLAHARRTSTRTGRATAAGRTGTGAPVNREQNKAVRAWAAAHGHRLAERGRIPAAVREAFHHGDPAAPPGAAPTPPASLADSATEHSAPPEATVHGPDPAAQAPRAPVPAVKTPPAPVPAVKVGRDGLTAEEREHIRTWAQGEGIEVKTRGQLTKDLIANYRVIQARTGT